MIKFVAFIVMLFIAWAINAFTGWVVVQMYLADWGTWAIGAGLLSVEVTIQLVAKGLGSK